MGYTAEDLGLTLSPQGKFWHDGDTCSNIAAEAETDRSLAFNG